jgi:hypothetical protein
MNTPFTPSRGILGVIQGGKVDDPPVPSSLVTFVRQSHKGREVLDPKSGQKVRIPWVGFECVATTHQHDPRLPPDPKGFIFYTKSDVTTQSDDEDVAQELWVHVVGWVRSRGDGLTHSIIVRCIFANAEGLIGEDFWSWDLALPTAQMQPFGGAPNAMMKNRPQFAAEEFYILEFGRLALSLAGASQQALLENRRLDQAELQRYREADKERSEMQSQMIRDRRSWELDRWKTEMFVKGLNKFVQRFSMLTPYWNIVLGRFILQKFGGKKTAKEERATSTFRSLLEHLSKKGGVQTEADFDAQLDMLGIEGELRRDVKNLAYDFVMEKQQEAMEDDYKSKMRNSVFHPEKEEPFRGPRDPFGENPYDVDDEKPKGPEGGEGG